MEAYRDHTPTVFLGIGFILELSQCLPYTLDVGLKAYITARIPVCDASPGNCCLKTHFTSGILYP